MRQAREEVHCSWKEPGVVSLFDVVFDGDVETGKDIGRVALLVWFFAATEGTQFGMA